MNKAEEIFKEVPEFDNYLVSNLGRLFSKKNGIYLKPSLHKKNKTWQYTLCGNGKKTKINCARVVAMTWIFNPNPKLYTLAVHKNGDFNNYALENVEWLSPSQSVLITKLRYPDLNLHFTKKPSEYRIENIEPKTETELLIMRDIGYSVKQLSDIFSLNRNKVNNIIKKPNNTLTTAAATNNSTTRLY